LYYNSLRLWTHWNVLVIVWLWLLEGYIIWIVTRSLSQLYYCVFYAFFLLPRLVGSKLKFSGSIGLVCPNRLFYVFCSSSFKNSIAFIAWFVNRMYWFLKIGSICILKCWMFHDIAGGQYFGSVRTVVVVFLDMMVPCTQVLFQLSCCFFHIIVIPHLSYYFYYFFFLVMHLYILVVTVVFTLN